MMGWGYGFGWIGLILGALLLLLVLGGLLALIFLVSRSSSGSAPPTSRSDSNRALDILKERYSRGEITKEEYEQMRQDLME